MNKPNFDIGLLGWWYGENYGSMLTYYALNKSLEKLGYSVLMIHENLGYNGWRVKWNVDIDPMQFARRVSYNYTEQIHYENADELNEKCASFMVGSDQLWNPLIGRVNDDLFLDFVEDSKPRFSYGTSFGNRDTDKFSTEFIEKHSKDLKKFQNISVREDYGVGIARDIFGVDATQVVDPVFLLSPDEYKELGKLATYKLTGDYLAAFILDPNEEKRQVIDFIASKLKLDRIVILANPEDRSSCTEIFGNEKYVIVEDNKPENWLYTYANAKYIVTDSFHGSCFAAIFNKPFSSFYNETRGADRFVSLMSLLNLEDSRKISERDTKESVEENPNITFNIDYREANDRVERFAEFSKTWLSKTLLIALKNPKDLEIQQLKIQKEELMEENKILKEAIAIFSKKNEK